MGTQFQQRRLKRKRPAVAPAASSTIGSPASKSSLKLWQPTVLIKISLLILTLGPHRQFARGATPAQLVEKWTVGITGGMDEANRIASEIGCKNLGIVTGFNDVYLFEKRIDPLQVELEDAQLAGDENHLHRTKRELELHPSVAWVDPQTPQKRVKRGYITADAGTFRRRQLQPIGQLQLPPQQPQQQQQPQPPVNPQQAFPPTNQQSPATKLTQPTASQQLEQQQQQQLQQQASNNKGNLLKQGETFNDELWTHQWYLQDNTNVAHIQSDIDLKVQDVWAMGITGQGVVVTILDDGLEWNHTDIYPNYDPLASWDMNNNRSDPFPRYDSRNYNSHGTRCAGEVAMVANNKKCGVGVAPRARIGGVKCLDGDVADVIESMSLLHNLDHIDIYSGSWGPMDNGHLVEGPKRLASQALELGVKYGRKGRGSLYIWANGNGGAEGDNCNCDGYVTSIYTISVGAVTQQGQMPSYGERCSSTLAVTCSSGVWTDRKIVTTDLHNKCTVEYTGSSAAAPLAAGIFALVLEANSNITWRDAQHLIVASSDPLPIRNNPGWKRNSAGYFFNNRFGFGLMSAKAMVDAALGWQTVPRKSICIVSPTTRLPVYVQSAQMAQVVFATDGCQREYENQLRQKQMQAAAAAAAAAGGRMLHPMPQQQQQQQQLPTPVIYLEHVQVIVDIEYTSRGELDIFLVSPAGTVSTLMSRRPLDVSRHGFDKWPLMSVHFWGESSQGHWTLIVRDKESQNNRGLLRNATLILHGTSVKPAHMQKPRVYLGEQEVPPFVDPVAEFDEDNIYDLNTFPNDVSLVGDDSYPPTFVKSVIAMEKANSRRD